MKIVKRRICAAAVLALFAATLAEADQWDAPVGYYSNATGTGASLKGQLTSIMSAGHIQRSYGDFRYSAAIHDQDPNNPANILLAYDRSSVPSGWDSGVTWNREHVWPQSRQPGSASNSSRENLGDPHALRPATPSVNSSRGNDPFGFATTTGDFRNLGAYWFPGDTDKGDIARMLFYSDTRWTSLGLSLTDEIPTGNQMGSLSSLIAWNYLDPPDSFERRRNHTIYSQADNPLYYTNNRNAFVDHPEFVWSIYVDQQNDSSISIAGGATDGAAASMLDLGFGSVIVGATPPAMQSVTLNKNGNDGTYYSVTALGDATSTLSGSYNAFRTDGVDDRTFQVGLNSSTSAAGMKVGSISIDNLDVTTLGGIGRGANDGDDTINLTLRVLDHATPSFDDGSIVSSLLYDFGTVGLGDPEPTFDFDIFNLIGTENYTASLELDGIAGVGDTNILESDLVGLTGVDAVGAGSSRTFTALMNTSEPGDFWAIYTLGFSDEDLPGATALADLTLTLTGSVEGCPLVRLCPRSHISFEDGPPSQGVPEPGSVLLLSWVIATLWCRRHHANNADGRPVLRT